MPGWKLKTAGIPAWFPKVSETSIAILSAMLAIAFGISTYGLHLTAPDERSTDGIYSNPCCPDIVVKGRQIEYGSERVPLQRKHMKFGLTGYPSKPFGDFYMVDRATGRHDPALILFSSDREPAELILVDFKGVEHSFRRRSGERK
jgi:hypothetical protein